MVFEISFPRGGQKPPPAHKTSKVRRVEYDLFGKQKPRHKNRDTRNEIAPKSREEVEIEKNINSSEISTTTADLLTYRTIQEGMILLGCIREIQRMTFSVLLPGRISGRVLITQISAPYTKLLHAIAENERPQGYRTANELLYPGQYVATKIIKIDSSDEKFQVNLSIAPHDVNSEQSFKSVVTGMLLWGAISGIEEHGYVIDLGIKNCRAFLPTANVDDTKVYSIGELLWCVIQKCEITDTATILTVNAMTKKIESTTLIKETSLNYLQPGMQVEFTITNILVNGLEGKFLDGYIGYIHEGYLSNTLDKLSMYKVDQILTARIMYITPITKLTFLTLRGFKYYDKDEIKDGAIVNGNILNVTRGGLYIKINKYQKGYVSFKRLKKPLSLTTDLDYMDLVRKNYQTGSQHQCRVLSYDFIENVFICTMQKDLLTEQIFSYNDLTIGQDILVKINEIQKNGLLVQAGKLTGLILNEHLSDSMMLSYTNIKSKFNVGQKVKVKVWNINVDSSSLLLTMKPSFLNAQVCLTSYEAAEYNKQYPGIIVQITTNGILVVFFGNVKGWIPKNQLSFKKVTRPENSFQIGQVVNCTVIKCNAHSGKLSLSLHPPKAKSICKMLRLGQHVDVIVAKVLQSGLEVEIADTKVGAVVPSQHLTTSPSLANLMLETYSVDDKLCSLVCINVGSGVPILSLRETEFNEENIPSLNTLEPNTLLRCSVNSINQRSILLQSPITTFERMVVVYRENVCELTDKNIENLKIAKNQGLMAKVTTINKKQQNILATTELSECWDGDLSDSKYLLVNYFSDLKRIKEHWISQSQPLTKLKLGQILIGTVTHKQRNGSLILSLPNHVVGKVDCAHAINVSVGDQIKAVVLLLNFQENIAELSVNPNIITKINREQTGLTTTKIGKNVMATILLTKHEFILVVLKGSGNKQLAYLPTRLHQNDLAPNIDCYTIGNEIKTKLLHRENGYIIAMANELIIRFEKAAKAQKRVRNFSISSYDSAPKKKCVKRDHIKKGTEEISVKDEQMEVQCEEIEIENQSDNETMITTNTYKESNIIKTEIEGVENGDVEMGEPIMETKKKTSKKNKPTRVVDIEENEESKERVSKKNIDHDAKNIAPLLSGANNFWENPIPVQIDEESSDDEKQDVEESNKKHKTKKLTPAERAEAARVEEERLRKIETELADSDSIPKSADQFDRLVLANPNSSLLWINYIAFHLEATEIEKARAIARKALNTIAFREEQDKLNVWIAFLNLENRYGTNESFLSILEEAIKMNDSLTVHLHALNILSESNKTTEFLDLLGTVVRRYKQEPKMWIGTAEACYKCEQKDQARNLMHKAVKSLDEKQHINVIVQFAFMEAKFAEPERAEAILEKVLASYPRRVDVWCSYVDMLVKGNRIYIARNVLERAVSQKLPARKMKTIFTKFIQFETKFGDENNVNKVRQMASEYVKTALK